MYERQYLSPRPPLKISLKHDLNLSKGNDQDSTVEHRPVGKLVQQSLGEALHFGSSRPIQSSKPIEDRPGNPLPKRLFVSCKKNSVLPIDPGNPGNRKNNTSEITTDQGNLMERKDCTKCKKIVISKNRDDTDKFNLATDVENIDFNISGIPDEAVKRSQNFNIHDLIQRIVSHPQPEAVQNDLEQQQSFNAFSDESEVAIMDAGNTEICEIVNVEPKWQCKVCLKHCSTGVIYCTCGHLVTKDSAENRLCISTVLDSFSIPNFSIRKHRPHGHRYGKALGCKEYHTANQFAKKCSKKKYDSIHDRFIRDKTFRKSMIEVGRSEQMIIEMDKLASEDHSYKANKEEIEFYRGNWWIHTNVVHFDSVPTRYEPEFKNALSTMQRLKRAEDAKFLILVFLALACKLVGV